MSRENRLSVVVPMLNEEPNVAPLVEGVREALGDRDWELVLVDDGSTDGTADAAAAEAEEDPRVRLVRLARNCGQATAMQAGFERSSGEIVVSMDGDLQNDPRDIPRLLARLEEGWDLVAGCRVDRQEAYLTRTLPSRLANALIRWITGTDLRDNGCSLKAYRREVLERTHLYSGLHRFVAPLAAATAGARVDEVTVRHHPRHHGESKYGLSRTWKVLADLLTVKMLRSFRDRPLQLFGLMALALVGAGLLFGAASVGVVLSAREIVLTSSFVLPTAGLLCLEVAAFLLMFGLIAEEAVQGSWRERSPRGPMVREWGEAS